MRLTTNLSTTGAWASLIPVLALLGVIIFGACEKEDPNLSKYVVEDFKVITTQGDSLRSISTISEFNDTEGRIDVVVPDDGNAGKWFYVEFVYPEGITPISVTPVLTDSIDFSIAKTFQIKFTDKVTKKYTVTIVEQAPEAPRITAFSVPGAQQVVINNDASRVEVRVPQGANLTAIKPIITLAPNTAIVVGGEREFDFSTTQFITIKNGAIAKQYLVKVEDYGFTKVTTLLDRTLASSMRPGAFAASPETSIAMDATASNVFVGHEGGIQKYDLANPSAAPTEVNRTYAGGGNAPTRVLQTADNILFAMNPIWGGGDLAVSAWPNGTSSAPVVVARVSTGTTAIIQNFHIVKEGGNFKIYFVDRAPLRLSPRQDPIMHTVNLTTAQVTGGQTVTAFATTTTLTGLAAAGISDGPNIEVFPIPNSSEFIFNSGTVPPVNLTSSLGSPAWISSALLNSSSVGAKYFEFNRGKYLMYGVFSWSTNLANPNASKFVMLDLTKKGMRSTITDISNELANAQYGTWNSIQKLSRPMGGSVGDPGGFYCQTAYGVTNSGKLRVACLSAQNGFLVVECE